MSAVTQSSRTAALAAAALATVTATVLICATHGRSELLFVSQALGLGLLAILLAFALAKTQAWTLRHDIFSPLIAFPCAFVTWFGLGSVQWVEVPSIFSFGLFDPIPAEMFWYYGIALLGFLGGVFLLRKPTASQSASLQPWNSKRSLLAAILLALTALLCWVVLVAQFGVPGLNSSASELRLQVRGPFYVLLLMCGWTLFVFAPLAAWHAKAPRKMRVAALLLSAAVAAILASFAGRSNIFVPLLTLLIVAHFAHRRMNLRNIGIILLVIFLAMSLMGYVRDFSQSEASLDWLKIIGIPEPVIPLAYAGIYVRYSVATLRDVTQVIPAHVPYQYGAMTLAPLRTFLPGHQEMSDVFFKKMFGNEFVGAGQPATLLGPFYADFGVIGIFLGMLLFGALLQFCYRRMREEASPLRILMYAWVLQSGLFGLFATVFPYITTLLLPLAWIALDLWLRGQTPEAVA